MQYGAYLKRSIIIIYFICTASAGLTQFKAGKVNWTADGTGLYEIQDNMLLRVNPLSTQQVTVLATAAQLTPRGKDKPLTISDFEISPDENTLLIFTNTAKVWRYNTKGDYWVLNKGTEELKQIGKDKPGQSLMYAKLSPDGSKVAYVSEQNIYVENIASGKTTALTTDGSRQLINGTFDWVYEEEFGCRDGFRWSSDSKNIAYWQVDARGTRDYLMLNTTDSIYSFVVPVEYPKVGESPSSVRIGVVSAAGGNTRWMNIPGDAKQHYLPRMEWTANNQSLIVQQLNRKQNESKLYVCDISDAAAKNIYTETDKAWIDIKSRWNDDDPRGWEWINNGAAFLWVSEKDGWRHIYHVSSNGKKEILLTKGNYDIETISAIDEKNNYVYFIASPESAIQRYLYRTALDGKGKPELVSPGSLKGTHSYEISPGARLALHIFTNRNTPSVSEWIKLPEHTPLQNDQSMANRIKTVERKNLEFFTITTEDNVTMDGWITTPENFDSSKKYPVVLYVYGEPANTTVEDKFSTGGNRLFNGDMAKSGYFYVSFNNRGTPTLKGSAWRKSIYRDIGGINIRDQAMAMKKLLQQRPYLDTARVASWGWSGGGSSTLNLLFQYPGIFKTGIAVAAVANQLTYDNIYQERYMGPPQETRADYIKGSPVTYAKNLRGNLLYIHGTGDDNVHYQNAEMLLNELIKYNKQFQFMSYPNRTHGISEGEGTTQHLRTLCTDYLLKYCPPGGR
ncbi:S9 family peptidase [Agriterribacter sp.]|uniref:S9 family peptidase n=1 Tax=Agriterribacter sp. TaxID=2821509 RepID=UPI002BBB7DB9|nr:S9 family peptidase [Agriterribacter sp.]HTN08839.1 S9 family peptidase [Agriterribacter sp.]